MDLFTNYPELEICRNDIDNGLRIMKDCFRTGGKLLLCGNGGSAADCEHMAGELLKGFLLQRPLGEKDRCALRETGASEEFVDCLQQGLPVISLVGHPAFATAYQNDVDGRFVFAQQVNVYGKQEDVLLAISTSGNSESVCNAVICAKARGMKTIGLTGMWGGRLAELSDTVIKVPEEETYKIQEKHLPVYHYLCAEIEREFFARACQSGLMESCADNFPQPGSILKFH